MYYIHVQNTIKYVLYISSEHNKICIIYTYVQNTIKYVFYICSEHNKICVTYMFRTQ